MKKIKIILLLCIVVGIASAYYSIMSYEEYTLSAIENVEFYKVMALVSAGTSAFMTLSYVLLLMLRGDNVVYALWFLIFITVISITAPLLLFVMNFLLVNTVLRYRTNETEIIKIDRIKNRNGKQYIVGQRRIRVKKHKETEDEEDSDETDDIEDEAKNNLAIQIKTMLFYESYKKRKNNEIDEETYQRIRNDYYKNLGLDPDMVQEVEIEQPQEESVKTEEKNEKLTEDKQENVTEAKETNIAKKEEDKEVEKGTQEKIDDTKNE